MINKLNIKDIVSPLIFFHGHLLIERKGENIIISNQYNSNACFYLEFDAEFLYFSKNFYDLKSFDKKNIDKNILSNSINGNIVAQQVFINNAYALYHGYKLIKSGDSIKIESIDRSCVNIDPATCLLSVMDKIHDHENIAVSFSGGLDSTAILYTVRKKFPNKNIIAFTWYNKGSSNNDFKYSQQICNELSINLLKFDLDTGFLLNDFKKETCIFPPFPLTYLTSLGFVHYYVSKLDEYFQKKPFIILDGHGGDHLFFQSIPYELLDYKFLPKLKKYSSLYSINYYKIIKNIVLHTLYPSRKLQMEIFRNQNIFEALFETSAASIRLPSHINFFFPYVTPEMISCSESFDISETFNESFTRLHFRKSFQKMYNSDYFFRINKGHMTGAYQRELKNNYDFFYNLLKNGYLYKNKILDFELLTQKLKLASLGVGGFDVNLMNSIIFEMLYKELSEI
ncbi:7-cyano-7-deazaguanine synthase [Acinetobacter oleivorans]|uniref:asparagine synthase-related protein n=1 Tax=Acinetobacter oleivorans TaxID=1148157 RepID=UPI00178D057E|nr:asparagine synthase-related protein [Acinetobacter oleivorans]MBE2172126.1 7-cyano-7-deazaguanine synthase [Acinetobacter oleivorans]MDY7373596.1 asparagine synthase-related protein [Acinetobacter oleivorans]